MIEFKANCGHTVRARDEDAGGAVRCSYCGKTVAVPDPAAGNLDYLFNELPAQGPEETSRSRKWRKKLKAIKRQSKPGETGNPFGIVFRLCYFALLFIIIFVVFRMFVLPMFTSDEERARRLAGGGLADTPPAEPKSEPNKPPRESDRGLLHNRSLVGLFVGSVPSGAYAFALEESKAPKIGRIFQIAGAVPIRTDGTFPRMPDGYYVVEVALPWSDPGLNDQALPGYNDYLTFRRNLARASDAQRKQMQEDYFLPDEANNTFVADDGEQTYFVRQYRGVQVQQGRSKGVRAIFLPRLGKGSDKAFSIDPLLFGYVPATKRYGFDEKQVRNELHFYEVPTADQQTIMDALSRIGTIPYAAKDGKIRVFKIDICDGSFTTRVIREGGS
jgi:hypothetical protein